MHLIRKTGYVIQNAIDTVIGYVPDLKASSALVRGAKAAGFDVFTTLEELLDFLANH